MDEGDTGDIILQKCFPITDNDDYGLLERAYQVVRLVGSSYEDIEGVAKQLK